MSSRVGETGLTIVKSIVESWGWLFRRNHQELDFGIDGYLEIISDKRQVTGKSIAVQIKTGTSYFKETNEIGWIHRGDLSHLNYYLNHDLPVVLILVNDEEQKAFWTLLDSEKTSLAETHWKITVPFLQRFDLTSKLELQKFVGPVLDYATQLENYWNFNRKILDSERIIFLISREEVEEKNYEDLKKSFERLSVNSDLILHLKDRVDLLIDGYNDDPRELEQIKEVMEWVDLVLRHVRGLSFFLPKDKESHFLGVIRFCKMAYHEVGRTLDSKRLILFDRDKIAFEKFKELYELIIDDLNQFCKLYHIPSSINYDLTLSISEYLTDFQSQSPRWENLSEAKKRWVIEDWESFMSEPE
jgi:hypothetical protein